MNPRMRLLLLFAIVLGVARFVLVPWLAGQDQTRERLQAVTRQLDRAQAVAAAGEGLLTREAELAAQVTRLAGRAPVAPPGGAYRLQVQRELRGAVGDVGLELSLFDWVLDGEEVAAGVAFGRVRLQMEGPLRRLAAAHVDIEAGMPHVKVREVDVLVRRGGVGPDSLALATLILDVYFQPGGVP
jgi:hypothetical protein